jgi:DNA-binding transcriptional MocR family regulator
VQHVPGIEAEPAQHLPAWSFRSPGGGLSLWARLDAPVSSALAHAAERQRLRLAPGPRFRTGANLEGYLRLPFTLPAADLPGAAARLAAARASLGPAAPPPPAARTTVV